MSAALFLAAIALVPLASGEPITFDPAEGALVANVDPTNALWVGENGLVSLANANVTSNAAPVKASVENLCVLFIFPASPRSSGLFECGAIVRAEAMGGAIEARPRCGATGGGTLAPSGDGLGSCLAPLATAVGFSPVAYATLAPAFDRNAACATSSAGTLVPKPALVEIGWTHYLFLAGNACVYDDGALALGECATFGPWLPWRTACLLTTPTGFRVTLDGADLVRT